MNIKTTDIGTRKRAGSQGVSTVFTLIKGIIAERQTELAAQAYDRTTADGALEEAGAANPDGAQAAEDKGRMLELVELANRISELGYERFGQKLALTEPYEPTKARRTPPSEASPQKAGARDEGPNPTRVARELEARGLLCLAKDTAARHHLTLAELLGPGQSPAEAGARREFLGRLYDLVPSYSRMAKLLGRDHSGVRTAVQKYQQERAERGTANECTPDEVHVAATRWCDRVAPPVRTATPRTSPRATCDVQAATERAQ